MKHELYGKAIPLTNGLRINKYSYKHTDILGLGLRIHTQIISI